MADNPRIEDLRKRYHENPRRFFAPLANEYRKSGFLDRAVLLCEKHLAEQPENMNGLVVYGQTLFELGRHDDARAPFEMALKVDPENLIALRHLGDIARLGDDLAAAKGWYEKVLEFDRRNDDVLELLEQMKGEPDASPPREPRPPDAGGLISVAASVSVSTGPDDGTVDRVPQADPVAPPPKTPAGPGRTVVINAQALAARDRKEADAGTVAQPTDTVVPPVVTPLAATEASAVPRPSKRASLLDIHFDFSEMPGELSASDTPPAPALGAEAAEYGLADAGTDALAIETTDDGAPLGLEPTMTEPLAEMPAVTAGDDFQLAEYSADVSPLAGLESAEFEAASVEPLDGLDPSSVSSMPASVAPLEGLDRVDVTADNVESVSGLDGVGLPAPVPTTIEADADSLGLPLLDDPSAIVPAEEPSVSRPKPRMTKADLASIPLLADFGLEDDAPAPPSPAESMSEPPSPPSLDLPSVISAAPTRPSKATPAFVTETMAALYVQQGHLDDAIGVYRQLIAQAPDNTSLQAKLAELERMQMSAAGSEPASLHGAAEEMPEFEAPAADAEEPAPAPANAVLADVSFAGVGLRGQSPAAPITTPAVAVGPSAREFFGNFARRAVAATPAAAAPTPVAAPVTLDAASSPTPVIATPIVEQGSVAEPETATSTSGWPLDALFGAAADVRDLHAAEQIAGVGTFQGPDGGTGLDALLSGGAAAPAARKSVPRASEMLKFDQFFQTPAARSSPAEESDPAAAPGDDDLGEFKGWLKGLKP